MTEIADKIASLSPAERELYERFLAEQEAEEAKASEGQLEWPSIEAAPADRFEPFPLTDIQQAQWFGRSGLFELTSAAHVYIEMDSEGMDLDRLTQAWRTIVARHDQLRVVILPDLRQQVLEEVPPYEIKVNDLRGKSEKEVEDGLAEVRASMAHQILPAEKWPIWEIRASVMDGGRLRLHVSFDLMVADAWSFRVLMDEWTKVYEDLEGGRMPPELTFRDYVLGLEKVEETELFKRDLAYWRKHLALLPDPPQLPMSTKPADLEEHRSLHFTARVEADVWDRLQKRIAAQRLTASGFFLAAYSEAVTVWSKSPQFALNVTVFNRCPLHPDVNDILVGEFNSFILLAVDNSEALPFKERAQKLQQQLWQHLEHRSVSGVRLMRELARVRGTTSGGALMPAVFTSTLAHHEGEGTSPEVFPGDWVYEVSQTPQVWMEHHIWEEDGALILHCDVVDGIFPEGLFDQLFDAYVTLLHRLADSDEQWEKLDVRDLIPGDQLELQAKTNDTDGTAAEGMLHTHFSAQAAKHPQRQAVVSSRGTVTYAELDERSNQLGHWLRDQGVVPNQLVAVVMDKGWEQAAGALGALKAGGAYLPIDPEVPDDRLAYLLENGEVKVALTQSHLAESLSWPAGVEVLAVDGEALAKVSTEALEPVQKQDDIAYVIFTSGSTGNPKGVVIDHRGALNTILDINERFEIGHEDKAIALSSMSFDLSVYDLFGMLTAGGTVVMPETKEPDPGHWMELLEREGVTVWNTVPALMEMLVTHAEGKGVELPASLRLSLLSGDWIPVKLPQRLRAVREGIQIISLGGATEGSIWSIMYPIEEVDESWASIPYGKPLRNQKMYVLSDDVLKPCPTWVPGNLFIGGSGVAKGYWRDEEKTNASFITHPETGERLYRTGDMGRFLPDGNIEFLGREDYQVKVRGFRVELGEIENTLNEHPDLEAVVVSAFGADSDSRRLVAYVVPSADKEVSSETLSEFAESKLPDYMLPQSYVVLEALPLTPTGKIDRNNLPAPDQAQESKIYVAPRDATEEKLAQLWSDVLDVEQVGINDDFFELGGNSLLANQLLFQVHDAFQVELPLSKLFEATTIAKVSVIIEELILEQMENMSDEEVSAMLAAEEAEE